MKAVFISTILLGLFTLLWASTENPTSVASDASSEEQSSPSVRPHLAQTLFSVTAMYYGIVAEGMSARCQFYHLFSLGYLMTKGYVLCNSSFLRCGQGKLWVQQCIIL